MWFRRDLRLSDHGGLAAAGTDRVVALFVLDPELIRSAGPVRLAHLYRCLRGLDRSIRNRGGAGLLLRVGDPAVEVPAVAAAHDVQRVLVSGEYTPYGLRRDAAVAATLAQRGVRMSSTDTPYLHSPGAVVKGDGTPFSVFTPFWRAWSALPAASPVDADPQFAEQFALPSAAIPDGDPDASGSGGADEHATSLLESFVALPVESYDADRNRVDLAATSRLGTALHFGEIHPRTVVAAVGPDGAGFVRQLCWREFYADVLWRRPDAAWGNVDRRFDAFPWRDDRSAFDLWCRGRTGFPMVDAGMRQLLTTGWMHNRSRMVVASFLTKDLLLPWQWGARWFLTHLRDGDVANNSLGWQWVAGTGTDAAPYYRVFNPVLQGQKFDPEGDYVRRFVPELAHLPGAAVHTPWDQPDGYQGGYPHRIVDHAEARKAALAAYAEVKSS